MLWLEELPPVPIVKFPFNFGFYFSEDLKNSLQARFVRESQFCLRFYIYYVLLTSV